MNLLSVFLVVAKRLWNNKTLVLCLILGLTTAVALISSIPLYADAANFRVLLDELSSGQSGEGPGRPPFAFMYRYVGAWHGAVETKDIHPIDTYMSQSVPALIGLPVKDYVRYAKTDNFGLYTASQAEYLRLEQPLGSMSMGFISDVLDHIDILEGAFPAPASSDTEIVEVMISQAMAEETGMQVGDSYVAVQRSRIVKDEESGREKRTKTVAIQVRIAGVWVPKDVEDEFWFYNPNALDKLLVIAEESFRGRVAAVLDTEVYTALWYIVFDGDRVRTDHVPGLLSRITYVNSRVAGLLPNTLLEISPQQALQNYRRTTFLMTIILYMFAIPIIALVMYFIGLISGLTVERQKSEIAILKSRGTSDTQITLIYVLEGLIVGVIGLGLGIVIGRELAVVMGNAISFLVFGRRQTLPVIITPKSLRMALAGVGIALLSSLGPARRAAGLTVVSHEQERARSIQKPLWQRYFLDLLLLIPAGYGYYVLQTRGTINFLGDQARGDPFSEPLLFLAPALAVFAVSMLLVRLFPLVMELLARLTGRLLRSVSVVLAFHQLARLSRQYTGALLLLILTLSLATFTASMARTLDQSLFDCMYYRYGADYQLFELGEVEEAGDGLGGGLSMSGGSAGTNSEGGGWSFIPVTEYLRVPGVMAATRVGSYKALASIGGDSAGGQFYGVNRLEFPSVAFFRRDFAPAALGALMNRLGADQSAVLVSPNFLANYALSVGDRVNLTVMTWGGRQRMEFTIAGTIRYFPTYYPEEGSEYLFVGNLDYLFTQMGGPFPYDVWITTVPGADPDDIKEGLHDLDIKIIYMRGSREAIKEEQDQPARTGVFGILSVGFVAATILTVLGFLIHSFLSFRRRHIEFGLLRAIGLSQGQMLGFLALEQLLLVGTGITAGTSLGAWVSELFVPFLQVGTDKHVTIPPFVVLIAWDDITKIYMLFAAMLVLAIAGLMWLLTRLKMFEAVKLGNTA